MSNNRGKSAAERLLGAGKEDTNPTKATTSNEKELKTTHEHIVMNKKNIEKLIKQQGNSKRNADSIRINPILANALNTGLQLVNQKKVNLMLSKKRF